MFLIHLLTAVKNAPVAAVLMFAALLGTSGCSTLSGTPPVTVESGQRWALLPLSNLSPTPRADGQAQALIETRLRARGVSELGLYQPEQPVSLRALLEDSGELGEAVSWARGAGYRYGLTGTIQEWNYQSGPDREPVVGINLKLLDLTNGQVLWQASAARTGWGFASLPELADSVIDRLLEGVRFESR